MRNYDFLLGRFLRKNNKAFQLLTNSLPMFPKEVLMNTDY